MFFLIDKPVGISSFDVIRRLRKILQVQKMGHAGTLDPLASGCLLVATGNSTKLLSLLDTCEKEYTFRIHLNGTTDSLDLDTEIRPVNTNNLLFRSDNEVIDFLESQEYQVPPQYSALHINGKRAYELARAGKDFKIVPRPVKIRSVSILKRGKFDIYLSAILSSGGYVRSLAPLLGKFFGTGGGYITELRRTKIFSHFGVYTISELSTVDNPREIPYSKIFHTIPTIEISEDAYQDMLCGRIIRYDTPYSLETGSYVFFSFREKGFLGICKKGPDGYSVYKNYVD